MPEQQVSSNDQNAALGHISKLFIKNFKSFSDQGFWLELKPGLNIIVGDNETGKSSILEAINLVLSGLFQGRHISYELNQEIFNKTTVNNYIGSLNDPEQDNQDAPSILIELYFDGIEDDATKALLEGDGNESRSKACGVKLKIGLGAGFSELYDEYIKNGVTSLPIEYYECSWSSFARDENLRPSNIPINSALIDTTASKYQNGSDIYVSRIVKNFIEKEHEVAAAQAHRLLKDKFNDDQSVTAINSLLDEYINISDKKVTLSIDMSSKASWDGAMVTYVDGIPFHLIGKGEQTKIKTKLSLNSKKIAKTNILLIEEPESHLSHHNLNNLITYIEDTHSSKQIIISTHSSFVANKLGLEKLVFISPGHKSLRLDDIDKDAQLFFRKLPGFDTLRLILAKHAILVEGPSDELIVQRAYMDSHEGTLPLDNGIEVISVGTSFLQFLKIADKLEIPTSVITDNDGDVSALEGKYEDYIGDNAKQHIKISYDGEINTGQLEKFNYNTLEPLLLKANSLTSLNGILGKSYATEDKLLVHMHSKKTDCALKIFTSNTTIEYPDYIKKVVVDDEQESTPS
ncbi:MAG: AAA family ATPase [Candidatus Saccharimonadales bacterium]